MGLFDFTDTTGKSIGLFDWMGTDKGYNTVQGLSGLGNLALGAFNTYSGYQLMDDMRKMNSRQRDAFDYSFDRQQWIDSTRDEAMDEWRRNNYGRPQGLYSSLAGV